MADDKQSRDEQADDENRRQRERNLKEARERDGEAEPSDGLRNELDEFEVALDGHEFPATAEEVVESFGDYELETEDHRHVVGDVLSPVATDDDTYESPGAVRDRVRRRIRER